MRILGTKFHDILTGTPGKDTLRGRAGDDVLNGMAGADRLFGGDGSDRFIFDTRKGGTDTVLDFTPGEDIAVILAGGFYKKLNTGFDDFVFVEGGRKKAAKDDPSVMYNPNNGNVFLDPDGKGGFKVKKVAEFAPGLDMDKGDFFLT